MPSLSVPLSPVELALRRAEHGTAYSFCLSLEQVFDLAVGYCPLSVTAMARMALETDDQFRRKAEKRREADEARAARQAGTRRRR